MRRYLNVQTIVCLAGCLMLGLSVTSSRPFASECGPLDGGGQPVYRVLATRYPARGRTERFYKQASATKRQPKAVRHVEPCGTVHVLPRVEKTSRVPTPARQVVR